MAFLFPQVGRYDSFVTRADLPPQRIIASAPDAHWVTLPGRLNLDHIRTEVGKDGRLVKPAAAFLAVLIVTRALIQAGVLPALIFH